MRVAVGWLRDYVKTDASAEQIAQALSSRGLSVESIERQPMPALIVIGKVATLERHPNADRLWVSTVDVGSEKLQIVTGADNVKAGDKVPIALVGATVYERGAAADRAKTKTILKTSLRGVESSGMMGSADELALPGDFEDGIIILEDDAPVGVDFWRVARFGDATLDIEVPANRPDCLSVVGVAREAAAALSAEFIEPHLSEFTGAKRSPIAVEIGDPGVCRRFVGQYFWGIAPRRTPLWMKLRLHAAGVRSLNFSIDVSNYAQLETGQPLHFYDGAKIRGGLLSARGARGGERLTTLDGVERDLPEGTPVIADAQRPVGIAGIFGGDSTAVTDATQELFLEAANFVGARIRRSALALGLRTEAGSRHEKNLPLELAEFGRRHAAKLLIESGATASAVVAVGESGQPPRELSLRPARANLVLGTKYSPSDMRAALNSLGFKASGDNPVRVTAPFWRTDIVEEIDLVEEVARSKGYDDIPERAAVASPQSIDEGLFSQESLAARTAAALGYREIVTLALFGSRVVAAWERSGIRFWSDVVNVANPLSEEQRILRPSLLPGLLGVAAREWPRTKRQLKFFETGHVFRSLDGSASPTQLGRGAYAENAVLEWPSLSGIVVNDGADDDSPIDLRLRETVGDVEALIKKLAGAADLAIEPKERDYFHPGASAVIRLEGRTVAKVGRLHPRLARAFELPPRSYAFALYPERLPLAPPVLLYKPLPRIPGTLRDIAVVVDFSVTARELVEAAREAHAPFVESVTAFDEYRGAQIGSDKKSIALNVALRKTDATITDAEADGAVATIVSALKVKFGAVVRGPAA